VLLLLRWRGVAGGRCGWLGQSSVGVMNVPDRSDPTPHASTNVIRTPRSIPLPTPLPTQFHNQSLPLTGKTPARGWRVVFLSINVGRGEAAYRRGREALRAWRMHEGSVDTGM
jgi:hypothetical protein